MGYALVFERRNTQVFWRVSFIDRPPLPGVYRVFSLDRGVRNRSKKSVHTPY
jgi:hypothetical protein